jgi:hypothetical protein
MNDCKLGGQETFHLAPLFLSPIVKPHALFYLGAGHKRDKQSAFSHVLPIGNAEPAIIEKEGDNIGVD